MSAFGYNLVRRDPNSRARAGVFSTPHGDIPMPVDTNADNRLQPAVWRMSTGTWFIRSQDLATFTSVAWGTAGDIPLSGRRR